MRLLLTSAAVLLASALSASATILVYEGPAPVKIYGTGTKQKKNQAYLVIETETSRAQLINFYAPRNGRDFAVLEPITLNSGTIPGVNGSTTVATGSVTTEPQPTDFDTIVLSFRGRNRNLDASLNLIHPRVISGIYRRTTKSFSDVTHVEQRFTLRFAKTITAAANRGDETLEEAVERVRIVLENRRYTEVQ